MQSDHTGALRVEVLGQDVTKRLVARYGPKVLNTIRRYLPRILRSKFDSQDFAQMAWLSVFRDPRCVEKFENSKAFAAFVAAVAANKVKMALRHCLRQKCDVNRECGLEEAVGHEPVAGEPRPSAAVAFRDELGTMLEARPEHYRQVLVLRSDGMSTWEIAQQTNLNETTVRRILRNMLEALQE